LFCAVRWLALLFTRERRGPGEKEAKRVISEDTKKLLDGDRIERLIQMVAGLISDVADIKTRLTSLEQKVEERLYDTRPIWENVQAQIAELREEQTKLSEGQEKIGSQVRALRIAFGRSYGDMLTTHRKSMKFGSASSKAKDSESLLINKFYPCS
jgi:DNA repair ATPase RecN